MGFRPEPRKRNASDLFACKWSGRRPLWTEPELAFRTVPHRSTSDGQRLLLSPGCDLRWVGGPGVDLLRDQLSAGVRNSHARGHGGGGHQLCPCASRRPGNQGQGVGARPRRGMIARATNMAAKKGTGLLMGWADGPADQEAGVNRRYNEEDLREAAAIPRFLGGARLEAVQ